MLRDDVAESLAEAQQQADGSIKTFSYGQGSSPIHYHPVPSAMLEDLDCLRIAVRCVTQLLHSPAHIDDFRCSNRSAPGGVPRSRLISIVSRLVAVDSLDHPRIVLPQHRWTAAMYLFRRSMRGCLLV